MTSVDKINCWGNWGIMCVPFAEFECWYKMLYIFGGANGKKVANVRILTANREGGFEGGQG